MPIVLTLLSATASIVIFAGLFLLRRSAEQNGLKQVQFYDAFSERQKRDANHARNQEQPS